MANHTRSYQLGFHILGVDCMVKSYLCSGIKRAYILMKDYNSGLSDIAAGKHMDEEDPFADCDEEMKGLQILNPD